MSELLPQLIELNIPDNRLPEPDLLSYYVLEKERRIYLDQDITVDVMAIQRMILRWNIEDKGKPVKDRVPIRIYIMSYGGDLDYMWMLVDAIELSETPVYTINLGVAASAASLIFIAGHRRVMTPNARVIIHEGSAQLSGDAVKVMDATESYKKDLKKMKDYILERTQIPKTMLNKKRNNDWSIDADYCMANGVCHAIARTFSDLTLDFGVDEM